MPALEIGLLEWFDHLCDVVGGGPAPAERRRALVESAVQAERLGFDSWWLDDVASDAEDEPLPSTAAVLLAAVAARTERMRLGVGVPLLAALDLLRVAEDVATLDGISSGRVELMVQRAPPGGLAGRRLLRKQIGDEDDGRFRESVELLRRLWTETDLSWRGRVRGPLEHVTVEPRPVQQPHPPLWIATGSPRVAELAGELGLPLLLELWEGSPLHHAALVERYRERAARAGLPARVGARQLVLLAAISQEARERWHPDLPDSLLFRGGAGRRRPLAGGGPPEDGPRLHPVALRGGPAEVADSILAAREALGLDVHLSLLGSSGPPELLRETHERFARDVLPTLRAS